jgi:multisubunit Na+/H+ antiporter MnhB subunit
VLVGTAAAVLLVLALSLSAYPENSLDFAMLKLLPPIGSFAVGLAVSLLVGFSRRPR